MVMCDLKSLAMSSRTLNVTATDGQHFSDVTPIILNFESGRQANQNQWFINQDNSNYNYQNGVNFKCRETDVASRLTDLMAKAERNNNNYSGNNQNGDLQNSVYSESDQADFHLSSALPSRFGSNLHQPEIRDLPSEISVKETAQIGTKLLQVRQTIYLKSRYCEQATKFEKKIPLVLTFTQ